MSLVDEGLLERSWPFQKGVARGRTEGRTKGRTEGEAQALLTVLTARGFGLDDATRARIAGCQDLTVLTEWIRRAATVTTLAEVFGAAPRGA